MMSPLSVAYFLEAGLYNFDMVIFDEASQIFPEDAIGAIYRAKQVIIAGDTKQLPPTSFFASSTGNSEQEYDDDRDIPRQRAHLIGGVLDAQRGAAVTGFGVLEGEGTLHADLDVFAQGVNADSQGCQNLGGRQQSVHSHAKEHDHRTHFKQCLR